MDRYNYFDNVKCDVKEYIRCNVDFDEWIDDRDGLEEYLLHDLSYRDSVTGNASGSYTFNIWEAEENLCHNRELLAEAAAAFGTTNCSILDAEACDVLIRSYLLPTVISEVLDKYECDGVFDEVTSTKAGYYNSTYPTIHMLKEAHLEKNPDSKFFNTSALEFFGECLSDMDVLPQTEDKELVPGEVHHCYVVTSIHRTPWNTVIHKRYYFDKETLEYVGDETV